jgi:hypothetical protein
MVEPLSSFLEEAGHNPFGVERLHELDVDPTGAEECDSDPGARDGVHVVDGEAQERVSLDRGLEVVDGNPDMMEGSDHTSPLGR